MGRFGTYTDTCESGENIVQKIKEYLGVENITIFELQLICDDENRIKINLDTYYLPINQDPITAKWMIDIKGLIIHDLFIENSTRYFIKFYFY